MTGITQRFIHSKLISWFRANPFSVFNIACILIFSCLPIFLKFPYRINLYLAWEGAYRMMNGELAFRDFGMPLGYGFWLIPTLFFYLFGPLVSTLLKAQAFINIICSLAFWGILSELKVKKPVISLSLLVLIFTFVIPHFWPWYNHSTITFEFVALYFAIRYIVRKPYWILNIVLSALFTFLSFWTKQDGGGLTLMLILALMTYDIVVRKYFCGAGIYLLVLSCITTLFIIPLIPYDFGYWFNYGQSPHFSRLGLFDIIDAILGGSQWEKFYLVIIGLIIWINFDVQQWIKGSKTSLFTLLVLGIMVEALIFQVTSYIPRESNIFFHAFAVAFILNYFSTQINFEKWPIFFLSVVLISAWWSDDVWNKFLRSRIDNIISTASNETDVIDRHTFIVNNDTTSNDRSGWIEPNLHTFRGINIPSETVNGINEISTLIDENGWKQPYVLNMSELTPLNYEFNFLIDKGDEYPLWFHKGVCMFDREVELYCKKINLKDYDLILFEVIPQLNEFYPSEVRKCIQENYDLATKFLAPRIPDNAFVEVYIRKSNDFK